MLHWSSVFLIVLLETVVQQSSAIIIQTMCHGHPYGTLLPNPQDCNSYYICESRPQLAYCDHGLHFDRLHKVCNWPNWANCIIEEVEDEQTDEELFKPAVTEDIPSRQDSEEEKPEDTSVDASVNQTKEDISLSTEDVERPSFIPLSKEETIEADNDVVVSYGVGKLVVSSLSKEPNSKDSVEESVEVKISHSTQPVKNPILAIEIPVADAHTEPPINVMEILNSTSQVIQVAVAIPAEIPDFPTTNSKPLKNATQTIQVAVAVPVEFPTDEVPDSIVAAPDATPQAENNVEKVESSKPSENSNQVIELPVEAQPEEVSNTIANAPDATPQAENNVEKVESSKPSENSNQVIELPVEAQPEEVSNTIANAPDATPQAENNVEKVESSKPSENSNQVIELPVEAQPEEVSNTIENAPDLTAQVESNVEKVESSKPLENSNQVIELPVEAQPEEVSNTISNAPDFTAQAESNVEKVESSKPLENSNQVIELPVEAPPEEVSNTISNAPDFTAQAESNVEKVESSKPSENTNQVIELPVEAQPNSVVSAPDDMKVDSSKPSEIQTNSNQVIEPIVPAEEQVVLKAGDKPSKNPTDITELVQPIWTKPVHTNNNNEKSNSHSSEELSSESSESSLSSKSSESSESSESSQSSQSSQSSESVESSKEIPVNQVNQSFNLESSEEYQTLVDKVNPIPSEEKQDSPESNQSSNEDSAHQHNIEDSYSSEDDIIKPNHHHHHQHHQHAQQANVEKEEKPDHSKESSAESNEDSIHLQHQPHAPNKPNKFHEVSEEDNNSMELLGPIGKPITTQTEANSISKNLNLIVSILTVASFQGNSSVNGTINRPIVGAHSTETGQLINAMTGYNSKNVQCIHNGLYFLPHPGSCEKYFICAYHHLHLHSCGATLIWNYKREQCQLQSDYGCYIYEISKVSSSKPDDSDKSSEDKSAEEITPDTIETTTSPSPMPPLRTTQSTSATVRQNSKLPICPPLRQVYLANLYDCNKYYICILGQPVLTSCPENLYWDVRGKFCGQLTEVKCAGTYLD